MSAVIAAIAGVGLACFIFGVLSLTGVIGNQDRYDRFRTNCVAAGGHIYSLDVAFCLTPDGRFVEVYP